MGRGQVLGVVTWDITTVIQTRGPWLEAVASCTEEELERLDDEYGVTGDWWLKGHGPWLCIPTST